MRKRRGKERTSERKVGMMSMRMRDAHKNDRRERGVVDDTGVGGQRKFKGVFTDPSMICCIIGEELIECRRK